MTDNSIHADGCRMFGHHPDSADDFMIEVDDIVGETYNWRHKIPGHLSANLLLRRYNKALAFRFVPGGECEPAAAALRNLASEIGTDLLAEAA